METADGWVAAETESVFDQIAFLNYLKNLRGPAAAPQGGVSVAGGIVSLSADDRGGGRSLMS